MNQYEVPALIADELPEVEKELHFLSTLGNVNDAIKILTDYTKKMVLSHKFYQVSKCMQLADKIYKKGNGIVKNAVENIFIYSFSIMRISCNKVEWRMLQANIPPSLYTVYIHQVTRPGY